MAEDLGVSRNTVSNWINGRGRPCEDQLKVWSAITDAPLRWLENGELPPLTSDGSQVPADPPLSHAA